MNSYPHYQYIQPRDRNKSYLESLNNNQLFTSQTGSQQNNYIQNVSSINQSDKYKSYYTEYQDFRHSTVS